MSDGQTPTIAAPTAPRGRSRLAVPIDVPQRLHPASPLIDTIRALPRSISGLLPALVAIGWTGRAHLIVPALIAVGLFAAGAALIRFRRFRWTVGVDAVAIDSGVFARQHRTIPYERLQDLHIEQRALDRLFGLAVVRFDTGGGAGSEATLDSIDAGLADALRAQLRSARAAALPAVEHHVDTPGEEARPLYAMSSGRVVLSGLFAISFTFVAIAAGVLQSIDGFLPDRWFEAYVPDGAALNRWFSAASWVLLPLAAAAALAVGLVSGVLRSVLTNHGFTLDRVARGLRRRRGLITRSDVTIPLMRVQGARLSAGIVERRLGYARLALRSLGGQVKSSGEEGGDNAERHGQDVAPFATLAEVDAILGELDLDRAGFEEGAREGWHHPPLRALLLTPVLLATVAVMLVSAAMFVPEVAQTPMRIVSLLFAASAALMFLSSAIEARTTGWRIVGNVLHLVHGWLDRTHQIVPLRSVHSAEIRRGPIDRALGFARIALGVPGPVGADDVELIGLRAGEAAAVRAALLR